MSSNASGEHGEGQVASLVVQLAATMMVDLKSE
jgi:hypothetical protein